MPIPRIAIVGRPNVGKSSLMNMLARSKVSIVDPAPGVTRDRVTAIVHLDPPDGKARPIIAEVVDTGGFGAYVAEGERYDDVGADLSTLAGDIENQIAQATGGADLVLFAVDAQAGVTALDEDIARRLRERTLGKSGKAASAGDRKKAGSKPSGKKPARVRGEATVGSAPPIQVVATKTDSQRWEPHAMEASALGFGEPWIVSAKNNYRRREFVEHLYEVLDGLRRKAASLGGDHGHAPDPKDAIPELKLAIIGKRNAGKSTLVNTLAGEPRMIVSEIAGTTRDSVDVRIEHDGRVLVAIDTAGLRRKRSFANQVEWYAFDRLQLSVERADVVMLLIDATVAVSQVDQQVAMLAQKASKPTIIVVNKWDLAAGKRGPDGKKVTTERYEEYMRKELKGLWFAPIAFMSGASGLNVRETIDLAFDLHEQASRRVTTGKLNRLIARIMETSGPTDKVGSQARVYYVAQTSTNPPTISLVVNKIELFTPNYQRFLLNRFREELPFPEVPIKLNVRPRSARVGAGDGPIAAAGVRARKADPQGRSPKSTAEEYFGEFDQPGAQGDEGGAADGRESEGRAPGTSHGKPATRSGSKTSAKAPGGKKSTRRSPATSSALADPQDPHHPDGSLDPEDEIDADAYFAAMELEGMGDDIDDEDEDEAP